MKKVISILLLLTVLLTVAQNAYASEEYNGITCEGITEEEYFESIVEFVSTQGNFENALFVFYCLVT